MSTVADLMGAGVPAGVASQIGTTLTTALTAAGTTKADALQMAGTANFFGTVGSGTGAKLPAPSGSAPVVVYNGGANALLVYSYGTADTINALSANGGFSVTNAKPAIFTPAGSKWVAVLGA
jgi:hypothetical protein